MIDPQWLSFGELLSLLRNGLEQRTALAIAVVIGTLIALAALNAVAPRLGLIDSRPPPGGGERAPTALTGGLAILCGVWLGTVIEMKTIDPTTPSVLALLGIVAAVHSFDDSSGLSALQRLLIDAIIALAFVVITSNAIETLGTFGPLELTLGVMATPFTVFMYVAISNAYNMHDGIDGLALCQALIALATIGLYHLAQAQGSGFAPHAFPVFVAGIVILLANLGRLGGYMRCYLGDSGARFLGFFLVYVLVHEGHGTIPPVGALYFVAVPLLDMSAVVVMRLRAGQAAMQPDRRHLHHCLVDGGVPRGRALLLITGLSLVILGIFVGLNGLGASQLTLALVFLALWASYATARAQLIRLLVGLGRGRGKGEHADRQMREDSA